MGIFAVSKAILMIMHCASLSTSQEQAIQKKQADYLMLRRMASKGDTVEKQYIDYSKLRLSLVISHCDEDMSWMKEKFNIPIENVTIYSKCGSKINGYLPAKAKIVQMLNIGRCDHSYAHWMSNMVEKDATENHLVMFFKASRDLKLKGFNYRPLNDVIQTAIQNGFACEATQRRYFSYYSTDKLGEFSISKYGGDWIKSRYSNMAEWWNDIGIKLPAITPVCYTGNFVAKATQIYSQRHIMSKIEKSLSRGNSIEEGHFAERTWAGLLSYPISAEESGLFGNINDLKMATKGVFKGSLRRG